MCYALLQSFVSLWKKDLSSCSEEIRNESARSILYARIESKHILMLQALELATGLNAAIILNAITESVNNGKARKKRSENA